MHPLFRDRAEAGRQLADRLRASGLDESAIVLGLARGGAVVGREVARQLGLPSDLLVVRKLGVPGHEELAMGAIAGGDVRFLDPAVIRAYRVPPERVAAVAAREHAELIRREHAYRGSRPAPELRDRTVVLVDDGIATGATMQAAVRAVELQHPRSILVAAPVASTEAVTALRPQVAAVVTVLTTNDLSAIGEFYRDFHAASDDEVRALRAPGADGPNSPSPAFRARG